MKAEKTRGWIGVEQLVPACKLHEGTIEGGIFGLETFNTSESGEYIHLSH